MSTVYLVIVCSIGGGSAAAGSAADGHPLKLLNLIDLLFDSHLGEPEALVDAPLFENLFHVGLAGVLRGRVTLRGLARLGQDDHLVHIFLSFDDVLVGAGY